MDFPTLGFAHVIALLSKKIKKWEMPEFNVVLNLNFISLQEVVLHPVHWRDPQSPNLQMFDQKSTCQPPKIHSLR